MPCGLAACRMQSTWLAAVFTLDPFVRCNPWTWYDGSIHVADKHMELIVMRVLAENEFADVSGGMMASEAGSLLSGALGGAAWGVAELGLGAMTVPVVGTALGGFLEAGAAVTGIAAGVAALAGY